MFKARTSRTLLTILGISVGIAAILSLVSFGYGLQKTLLERITTADSLVTLDVSAGSGEVSINENMMSKVKDLSGVVEISPAFQLTTQGHLENLSADLMAVVAKPSFMKLGGYKAVNGTLISDADANGIVISSAVAQVFNEETGKILNKEMTFSFFVPKSAQTSASNSGVENGSKKFAQDETTKVESDKKYKIIGIIDSQENIVYINSAAVSSLNVSKYTQMKVKTSSSSEMSAIRETLMGYGLAVSSLSDTVDQANKIFRVVQIVLMLFGFIALFVSAIGMFNTMTITLLERTEEIGIMKSIGASDRAISMMFFMESVIMGFLGGCAGVGIGSLVGLGFNALVNIVAVRLGGEKVSLFYTPLWFILSILSFSAVVGFFTGLAPARRASKIDPLDALRYK